MLKLAGMFRYFKTLILAHVILFYIFVSSGLIVNFLQLISLVVWPFSKQLYRKINCHLAYLFWSNLTALAQYWSGSNCVLYIKPEDLELINKEHSICIMNHKYDVDWLMGWIVCQRVGLLAGSKIIGKSSLRFIPLIGWCWMFTESIFIKRKWEIDHKTLVKSLDQILVDYPKNYHFNILMFCEGTRFTRAKHEASMKIAREKGLPELKHHLLPRTKGFSLLARGAAGRIGAIYDLNVGIEYKNNIRPDFNAIQNGIPLNGEMLVRRISMSEVPNDDEGSAKFIHKLYQEKDEIYDVYSRTGSFASLGLKRVDLSLNYYDLCIVSMWALICCSPMVYYLYVLLSNASLLVNLLILALVFISSLAIKLFISVTQTETGSKYGLNKNK